MEAYIESSSVLFKQRAAILRAECRLFMVNVLTCTLCIAGPQNPGLGRKSHGYNSWNAVGVIPKDFLETRALLCNIQNVAHRDYEELGSTRRTFCWNMTILVLAPRKPPLRQLRRWISPSYHFRHTVHASRHATTDFFPEKKKRLRGYLYDSDGEAGPG